MPEGNVLALHSDFWKIFYEGGTKTARFHHPTYSNIQDGAWVTFTLDAHGMAQNVRPAGSVTRYLERRSAIGALDPAAEARLMELVTLEIQAAATETGRDRHNRLRRLRRAVDRFEL